MANGVNIGGSLTLPLQPNKGDDRPGVAKLSTAPSNYVVVNDPSLIDAVNEHSCIIVFDWKTFTNKIIGANGQKKLKENFIAAITSVLKKLDIAYSSSNYEQSLNRAINKSLMDFRVTVANMLGGSRCSFSLENFKKQWVVDDEELLNNAFYGQSIIQEGIRFYIEARGRFSNTSSGDRDFYRIFTGFIEDINEVDNPLNRSLNFTASDLSSLLSATRFNLAPAIHVKDPIALQKDPTIFGSVLQGKDMKQIFEAIFESGETDKVEIQRPFYWKIESSSSSSIGFTSNKIGIVEEEYRRNWQVKRSVTDIFDYTYDTAFVPKVLLWGHTGTAYTELFGNLKLFLSGFKTRQDILLDIANITFFKTYVDGAGNFHFHPPRFEEEFYLNLNDGFKSSDVVKEDPLSNAIFDDDTLSQSYSQSSREVCTVARGSSEGGFGIYSQIRNTSDPNYLKPTIVWEDGVSRFGFKEANITTSATGGSEKLIRIFTTAFLLRRNQERFNMTASMIMRPELQVDRPVYDYTKNKIYYVRSITHTYSAGGPTSGGTYTTTISCNAGRGVGEKISSNMFASASSIEKGDFAEFLKDYAHSYNNIKDYRTVKSEVRDEA